MLFFPYLEISPDRSKKKETEKKTYFFLISFRIYCTCHLNFLPWPSFKQWKHLNEFHIRSHYRSIFERRRTRLARPERSFSHEGCSRCVGSIQNVLSDQRQSHTLINIWALQITISPKQTISPKLYARLTT